MSESAPECSVDVVWTEIPVPADSGWQPYVAGCALSATDGVGDTPVEELGFGNSAYGTSPFGA
jgi:hypothetical protein